MERVKRKNYAYTIAEAIYEHVQLARKAYIHNIIIDEQFYTEVLQKFQNTKQFDYTISLPYIPKKTTIKDSNGYEIVNEYILEEDGVALENLSLLDLERYIHNVKKAMQEAHNKDLPIIQERYKNALLMLKSRKSTQKSTIGLDDECPF